MCVGSYRSSVLLVIALASTGVSQQRLTVPGQFPEISSAVQAAPPGSIIEVTWRAQPYAPVTIDRVVTIVGRAGEHMAPTIEVAQGIGIDIQLDSDERAVLSRIDVRPATGAQSTTGIRVQGGFVTLEDCRVRGGVDPDGAPALSAVECIDADVSIAFCRFENGTGSIGLRATGSTLNVTKSRFIGSAFQTADAVQLIDSTLNATESWFFGGEDFTGGPGATGLRVSGAASAAYLVDCAITGGTGTPGGIALVNNSPNAVEIRDTGVGGGTDLQTFTVAAAQVGALITNPNLVGLRWSEPPYRRGTLQRGQLFGCHAQAPAGTPVVLMFGLGRPASSPLTRQPRMHPSQVLVSIPRIADALGYASVVSTVPDSSLLTGVGLWAQAVAGPQSPLEASPATGVVVR